MMTRPKAYEGSEPYIFVSYAHKDAEQVLPVIEGLQRRGVRLWYDEGIEVGSHWDKVISEHLYSCTYVICFITENFLNSENCLDEIHYAKEMRKGPLINYLETLRLPPEMYRYGRLHALSLGQFPSWDAFVDEIADCSAVRECRGEPDRTAEYAEQAEMYWEGNEIRQDLSEAARYLGLAARQGDPLSAVRLARLYEFGWGVPQSNTEALTYYQMAADAKSPGSIETVRFAPYGREEPEGTKQCVVGFRQRMNTTLSGQGCYEKARSILKTKGFGFDWAEAVSWLRLAAERGHLEAQWELVDCIYEHQGAPYLPSNSGFVVEELRRLAQQGDIRAMLRLGEYYDQESDVAPEEAVMWYRRAAEKGNAEAMAKLGECYQYPADSSGMEPDYAEAFRWYQKAAQHNEPDAIDHLADFYENGKGVARDLHEAIKWYQKSLDNGAAYRKMDIERCKKNLLGS